MKPGETIIPLASNYALGLNAVEFSDCGNAITSPSVYRYARAGRMRGNSSTIQVMEE
jgi:hypothetical protein